MIESTGGCFLTLTVIVTVDLVADHVDPDDLVDFVDLVVDLTHPADSPVDPALRSVKAFLFTV